MGWAEGAGSGEECEWGHEVWRGIQFQAVSVSSVNASQGVRYRGSVCSVAFVFVGEEKQVCHRFSTVQEGVYACTTRFASGQHGSRAPPNVISMRLPGSKQERGSTAVGQLAERSRPFLVRGGRLAALLPRVSALLLQPPLHPLPKVQRAALVCSGVGAREGQSLFDAS